MMNSSNTLKLAQVALNTSNVGVPGKWMFELGDSPRCITINHGRGMLDAYPRMLLNVLMMANLLAFAIRSI